MQPLALAFVMLIRADSLPVQVPQELGFVLPARIRRDEPDRIAELRRVGTGVNSSHNRLERLRRALKDAGTNAIDRRTTVGKELAQWRSDLVEDLGGEGAVSTQQKALVDLAVKSKLLLDSVDTWLLQQKSLINTRKKSVLPVVRERQTLADGLARYLAQLGLGAGRSNRGTWRSCSHRETTNVDRAAELLKTGERETHLTGEQKLWLSVSFFAVRGSRY